MGAPAAHALRGMFARVACGRALAGGGGCEWFAAPAPALDRSALWTSGASIMGRRQKHTGTDDGKDGGEGSGAQETVAESSSPAEVSGGDSTAPADAGRGPSPTLESYLGEIQRVRKSDKKRSALVGEDIGDVPRGMPRAARGSYADLPLDAARLPERLRRAPIGEPELRSLAKETFGLGRIENETLISELESTFGFWRPGTSARSDGDPAQSPEQQPRRRRQQKQDGVSADAVSDGGGGPLHWSSKMVVEPGKVGYVNPLNRKVRAWFHVRDLQEHYGLSDAALARIIRLVGPRYRSDAGVVTITSDRKALREENRAEIIRIILELVREGRRADEFVGDAESTASQQQERSSL